jgi:oxysterol-binding protein-related protein 3/6/7
LIDLLPFFWTGPSVASTTKEEALQLAQDMQAELASMTITYLRQRDQLKQMIDSESKTASLQPQVAVIASLRQSLNAALQQNAQLRTRLARIHAESDLGETPSLATTAAATAATALAGDYSAGGGSLMRGMNNSLSYSSSCISEFFDAREYADSGGDTDDDVSDTDFSDTAESGADEEDEDAMFLEPAASSGAEPGGGGGEKAGSGGGTMVLTGRRRTLPVPKTDTEGVNLWNLLCKNIGEKKVPGRSSSVFF